MENNFIFFIEIHQDLVYNKEEFQGGKMPKIRMPDGQIVAFPDDMPREQIKSLIAQKYPELQQQTQTDTFNVYTTNITQFRKQYPQYNDLSDDVLVQKLHDKFYPDMEMSEFSQHFGYKKTDLSKYSDEELMQIAGVWVFFQ